ncbi:HAMP domain-containing histidine kinase [Paenibacillus albidus]|uniref:HAMP domain-containing sensor histidine kinase n=1 Tax=Paenibacillus albidus TaxID=2041023 RepID=UPI001BE9A5CE|nr:HAMP domain-containing sensor histidine kinase [Paenibacillus albidus]MBT2289871.1 HAMP domain-containing histidine kinase [Paenibacillus albidus]
MKLSTKYLIIIVMSMFIFPVSFIGVNFLYYFTLTKIIVHPERTYYDPKELKVKWLQVIDRLEGLSEVEIISGLRQAMQYKDSQVSWLGENGQVLMTEPESNGKHNSWNIFDVFELVNQEEDSEFFTIVRFLKGEHTEGYVLLEVPRQLIGSQWESLRDKYYFLWFGAMGIIWMIFVFVSWLFFNQLRKRLVVMQENMEREGEGGIPLTVVVEKEDEIGQLEHSFNRMVEQLNTSRAKEQHEMELRKNLVANLSHDLRTPLTIIRGHAFRIDRDRLSEEDRKSLEVINDKVHFLGDLIDNLSSLTLLNAGKLPMNIMSTDVRRVIRASLSAWYPIFEQKDFLVEVELKHSIVWDIDETWLKRILNNLFQNIIRHAASGKYVYVQCLRTDESEVLIISDRGPGLHTVSMHKGIGIGLSIVTIMLEQLRLEHVWETSDKGTSITIFKKNSDQE